MRKLLIVFFLGIIYLAPIKAQNNAVYFKDFKVKSINNSRIVALSCLIQPSRSKKIIKSDLDGERNKSNIYNYFLEIRIYDESNNLLIKNEYGLDNIYHKKSYRFYKEISLLNTFINPGKSNLKILARTHSKHEEIGTIQEQEIHFSHYQLPVYLTDINIKELIVSNECKADIGRGKRHWIPDVYWQLYLDDSMAYSVPYKQDCFKAYPGRFTHKGDKFGEIRLLVLDDDDQRDDLISKFSLPANNCNMLIDYNEPVYMIDKLTLSYMIYKFELVDLIILNKSMQKISGLTYYEIEYVLNSPKQYDNLLKLIDKTKYTTINSSALLDSVYFFRKPAIEGINYNIGVYNKVSNDRLSHITPLVCNPINVSDVDYNFNSVDSAQVSENNYSLGGIYLNAELKYNQYYENANNEITITEDGEKAINWLGAPHIIKEQKYSETMKTITYFLPYIKLYETKSSNCIHVNVLSQKKGQKIGEADTAFLFPIKLDSVHFTLKDFKVPFKYRNDTFSVFLIRDNKILFEKINITPNKRIVCNRIKDNLLISNEKDDISLEIVKRNSAKKKTDKQAIQIINAKYSLHEWMKTAQIHSPFLKQDIKIDVNKIVLK